MSTLSILDTYAQLKLEMRALESKMEAMEPDVLRVLHNLNGSYKHSVGTITIHKTTTWKYSDNLKAVEANIKNNLTTMRKQEQDSGKATKEVKESPKFIAAEVTT